MNQTLVIANWKMNLTIKESGELAEGILKQKTSWSAEKSAVVLCPSFESLAAVQEKLKGQATVALGAQDCFWEETGAFTGEVSARVLRELGCAYVILGHSERRQNLGETDAQVNLKVRAALRECLVPIVCVGETFNERQEGQKDFVVMEQVKKALDGVKLLENDRLIIAYEPVWVIGSGQAVDPAEAEHTSRVIRQVILDNDETEDIKERVKIIYGGSVNPANVKSFISQPTISGILVGGASLEADKFVELIKECC